MSDRDRSSKKILCRKKNREYKITLKELTREHEKKLTDIESTGCKWELDGNYKQFFKTGCKLLETSKRIAALRSGE